MDDTGHPVVRDKLVDVGVLVRRLEGLRRAGRTVVHCHGCFDIVHPGHIRYLRFARTLGDVLVVSLTGDAGVAKGPDRPYIPQELRAENLAALEFVDYVVIDPHPTACELLELLRPDVYVKGGEYATRRDERFERERRIVERHGGRVVFHSGDVVFSSTRLIQALARDEALDAARLQALCARHAIDAGRLTRLVQGFAGKRVLVVGDTLRERYCFGDAAGTGTDAPMPVLRELGQAEFPGGAAALARQLQALGAQVTLFTAWPEADGEPLTSLRQQGVALHVLGRAAPVERTTFVSDDVKLLRLTRGPVCPLDSAGEKTLTDVIAQAADAADALVWSDHGCGLVSPGLVRQVEATGIRQRLLVAGHASDDGDPGALRGTDLLGVTERQLRSALHDMSSGLSSLAWRLLHTTGARCAMVWLHKRGTVVFDAWGAGERSAPARTGFDPFTHSDHALPERLKSEFIPSLASGYTDLLGSQESMLAVSALALLAGSSPAAAAYLSCAAEALVVARPGCAALRPDDLLDWLVGRSELHPDESLLSRSAPLSALACLALPLSAPPARVPAPSGKPT